MNFIRNLFLFSLFGSVLCTNKVKVTLFYESLCPYCQSFFQDELGPTFSKLPDLLVADLLPFGNARFNGSNVVCQHGPSECTGNLYHACAIAKSSNDDEAVKWTTCISIDSISSEDWEKMTDCSSKWAEIIKCAEGDEGASLIQAYGIRTKKQNIKGTPTALVDGKEIDGDLFVEVCNALKTRSIKPKACIQ